jgi:protein TonB
VDVQTDKTAEKIVEEKDEKPEVFTYVEEMPSFPGGQDEFLTYVASHIQYPEIAKRAGVEGKIFVSFVVGKDGKVSDVEVVKGIGAGCDEEAVRVIRGMPKWNPGKQNGRPVHVKVSVPIIFKLQ